MEIDKIGQRIIQSYLTGVQSGQKQPPVQQASEQTQDVGRDKVSLSQSARMMQRVRKAVLNVTDVRQEKVAALKKSIEDGTYYVSNEEILEGLIEQPK